MNGMGFSGHPISITEVYAILLQEVQWNGYQTVFQFMLIHNECGISSWGMPVTSIKYFPAKTKILIHLSQHKKRPHNNLIDDNTHDAYS